MANERIFLLVLLAALLGEPTGADSFVETKINGGAIRGTVVKSISGENVNVFRSIPYGSAVRFAKSQPAPNWPGTLNATVFMPICYRFGIFAQVQPKSLSGESEDCLWLNVWQPTPVRANRSVMVFIHGGAFECGSSLMDGKDLAAQGDVLIVTVNYRLGPLGFTHGGDIPANLGLHDQILALKWVQENIHHFGGNKESVTIFGESAGSISVGALLLSSLTAGLFKRAIMQSGAPTVEFLTSSASRGEEKTLIFAKHLKCPANSTISEAVRCIRSVNVTQMQAVSRVDFLVNELFVPVYGADDLLPLRPSVALKTGKFNRQVDSLMYGTTRDEGSGFAAILALKSMASNELTIEEVKESMRQILIRYKAPHPEEAVAYYTGKLSANSTQDDLKIAISNTFGDYSLVCPTVLFAEEMARQMPTARYFAYRLMENKASLAPKWLGVTHASDIPYLFDVASTKSDPELYQLSKDMISAWTAFAKTGSPGQIGSVQWEGAVRQAKKDFSTRYLSLETNKYKMVDHFYRDTCDSFWKPRLFA